MAPNLSRRSFLGAVTSGLVATAYMSAPPLASAARFPEPPRIAPGRRLRGLNHVNNFRSAKQNFWGDMWTIWDWEGWIRPQMDDIASVANACRFWGNTYALAEGGLPLSTYISRWRQALDYAGTKNLMMYPCGGDLRHWGGYTWDEALKCYDELAGLFETYDNVIGFDITNEAYSALSGKMEEAAYRQQEPVEELLAALTEVVRNRGVPLTHSRDIRSAEEWTEEYFTDSMGDFLDFHVYYQPGAKDSLTVYKQPWGAGKKLIIGEFGKNLTKSWTERAQFYSAVRDMCAFDRDCRGAFAWAARDHGSAESRQFGVFDQNRSIRHDIGDVFLTFPT